MITFRIPRLEESGIAFVQMALDFASAKISGTIQETLARYGCGPKDAQPFFVSLSALDGKGRQVCAPGFAEGVHHRTPLLLDGVFSRCRQVVYLHGLFIETKYQKCGIATNVLDCLPKLIDSGMGGAVDAIVLAPVPQYKNSDGAVVQMPLGMEFFIAYKKLIDFYIKRNFQFSGSMSLMGRLV